MTFGRVRPRRPIDLSYRLPGVGQGRGGHGGAGDLLWMLAGNPAPDRGGDRAGFRCPDADAAHGDREVCATLRRHAEFMAARRWDSLSTR